MGRIIAGACDSGEKREILAGKSAQLGAIAEQQPFQPQKEAQRWRIKFNWV